MPPDRQTGGEDDGVLFGDADVEEPRRELVLEGLEPGALRHRRRDGDDARVGTRARRTSASPNACV